MCRDTIMMKFVLCEPSRINIRTEQYREKKFNKIIELLCHICGGYVLSFDPVASINSGQVFLWEKHDNSWYGIHGDRVIKFTQSDKYNEFSSFPEDKSCVEKMFRLDDDIKEIFEEISHDPLVFRLAKAYPGLRLIRQDPHQCLFSFVCATNTNIPMIRRMLYNITRKFGRSTKVDGMEFFTFPSALDIKRATVNELREMRPWIQN